MTKNTVKLKAVRELLEDRIERVEKSPDLSIDEIDWSALEQYLRGKITMDWCKAFLNSFDNISDPNEALNKVLSDISTLLLNDYLSGNSTNAFSNAEEALTRSVISRLYSDFNGMVIED